MSGAGCRRVDCRSAESLQSHESLPDQSSMGLCLVSGPNQIAIAPITYVVLTASPAAEIEPNPSTRVPAAKGPTAVKQRAKFQQKPGPVARMRVGKSSGR